MIGGDQVVPVSQACEGQSDISSCAVGHAPTPQQVVEISVGMVNVCITTAVNVRPTVHRIDGDGDAVHHSGDRSGIVASIDAVPTCLQVIVNVRRS